MAISDGLLSFAPCGAAASIEAAVMGLATPDGGGETEDETGGADAKHGLTTGFIPDWFHFRLT